MKVETKYISLSFPVYSTYLAYISNIFWQKKKKKMPYGPLFTGTAPYDIIIQ